MTKTKIKPNAKDLLKKAFAHKNPEGSNSQISVHDKASEVFDDIPLESVTDKECLDKANDHTSNTAKLDPYELTPSVENALVANRDITIDTHLSNDQTSSISFDTEQLHNPIEVDDLSAKSLELENYPKSDTEYHSNEAESIGAEQLPNFTDDINNTANDLFVYTDEHAALEASELSFIDALIDNAKTEDIFNDDSELDFTLGRQDDLDIEPTTLLEPDYLISDLQPETEVEKNKESLSLLDQVKADKDARQQEYKESLKKLEAIESERSELEEIMRQQLIKQQEEEATKLNEGIQKIRSRNRNFLFLLRDLYRKEEDVIQADNLVGIAQTFKAENTITLQSYLIINRYLNRFNISYDLDQIRVFLNEDLLDINSPPLDFDYYYLWQSDLNSKITPYMWDKHKLMVFKRANFKCELCGGVGPHNPVELHPHWRMFDSNRTQILQGFLALCPKCVDAKNHTQLKNRNLKMRLESSREHIKSVNGWDDRQVENALLEADDSYAKRVDTKSEPEKFKKWKLNISVLSELFGIEIDEPKFDQRSHIKSDYHSIFEPHVSYLFGKIESDRMMKTGKIKFLSIKLDVELMKQAR